MSRSALPHRGAPGYPLIKSALLCLCLVVLWLGTAAALLITIRPACQPYTTPPLFTGSTQVDDLQMRNMKVRIPAKWQVGWRPPVTSNGCLKQVAFLRHTQPRHETDEVLLQILLVPHSLFPKSAEANWQRMQMHRKIQELQTTQIEWQGFGGREATYRKVYKTAGGKVTGRVVSRSVLTRDWNLLMTVRSRSGKQSAADLRSHLDSIASGLILKRTPERCWVCTTGGGIIRLRPGRATGQLPDSWFM